MFSNFSDVIAAINDLRDRGSIQDYAIAGAFALSVWDEVSTTFDLDVLVLLPAGNPGLIDLAPIYEWAEERGYPAVAEHIQISGVPVQFLPAPDPLAEEAIAHARTVPVQGSSVKVVSPEYLSALWLQPPANTPRRKARVAQMRESGVVDETLLADLMARYNLSW